MAWKRQGALWMLVAVILWTAAPLIACVPGLGTTAKVDCCAAMMQDCGATMSGSCCELAPTHNTATMVSAYAPEQVQEPGLMVREAYLPMLTDPELGQQSFLQATPPDPSPGGFPVLRI
jgi:hypothetical protein